jgi:hypothetical protein
MNGKSAAPIPLHKRHAEIIDMTPGMASALLKQNKSNRKFREYHANRIARLILGGRWQFNGDTVKLDFETVVAACGARAAGRPGDRVRRIGW